MYMNKLHLKHKPHMQTPWLPVLVMWLLSQMMLNSIEAHLHWPVYALGFYPLSGKSIQMSSIVRYAGQHNGTVVRRLEVNCCGLPWPTSGLWCTAPCYFSSLLNPFRIAHSAHKRAQMRLVIIRQWPTFSAHVLVQHYKAGYSGFTIQMTKMVRNVAKEALTERK